MTTLTPITRPFDLLERMFPGDPARGLPPFSALGSEAIAKLEAEAAALTPYMRDHADTLAPLSEVNDTLAKLRKLASEPTANFIFAALNAYFAAPAVVMVLRRGPAVLFPHARTLPDIDYDLLEPVLALMSAREPK